MVIKLSVFLGSNEHLQVFGCPVALWSEIGEDNLPAQHEGSYVLLTVSYPAKTRFNQIRCWTSNKI